MALYLSNSVWILGIEYSLLDIWLGPDTYMNRMEKWEIMGVHSIIFRMVMAIISLLVLLPKNK